MESSMQVRDFAHQAIVFPDCRLPSMVSSSAHAHVRTQVLGPCRGGRHCPVSGCWCGAGAALVPCWCKAVSFSTLGRGWCPWSHCDSVAACSSATQILRGEKGSQRPSTWRGMCGAALGRRCPLPLQGGALLGGVNALHTSFPENPRAQYQQQCKLILERLELPSLLSEELQRLER